MVEPAGVAIEGAQALACRRVPYVDPVFSTGQQMHAVGAEDDTLNATSNPPVRLHVI